jgi:hypothetical protein
MYENAPADSQDREAALLYQQGDRLTRDVPNPRGFGLRNPFIGVA